MKKYFFRFLHNFLAHPLLEVPFLGRIANAFHDWTAKMAGFNVLPIPVSAKAEEYYQYENIKAKTHFGFLIGKDHNLQLVLVESVHAETCKGYLLKLRQDGIDFTDFSLGRAWATSGIFSKDEFDAVVSDYWEQFMYLYQ